VSYAVTSNSGAQARSAGLTVGGQSVAVTQQGRPPTACSFALSPGAAEFGKDEATGTFAIAAAAECTWTATTTAPWIAITSASQGAGNGTLSYAVARNRDTLERTATIAVADRTFMVRQGGDVGGCQYSVAPVQFTPCMPTGTATVTVTTQAGCPWTASTNVPWLTLTSGSSGTGSGALTMSFTENYDAPREGIGMVRWPTPTAGQNVRVSQAGCAYAVTQSAFSFTAAAASASFGVFQQSEPQSCGGATQDRCIWTAVSDVPWIVITTPTPRAGDGSVGFSVTANPTASTRQGRITVRDKVVIVTQSGQ